MKIAIVAGGTGGHIYPAVTLARKLISDGHTVTFIGSNDRMEKDVIPEQGFDYIGLDVYSTRGSVFKKVKSLVSMVDAYFRCKKILMPFDMAIGFGNYISVPVILAAKKIGKPAVIHEQNSLVGKANKLLDKKVDAIIGSYEENRAQFKNPNTRILGNPQSSRALTVRKDRNVLKELGLNPDKKTVVIFMGSLGSESVESKLIEMFKKMDGSYQIVYATGKAHYESVLSRVSENENLKIFEKIDGITVMANSDLLVSRAGATTLCEIQAIGMPSILIPSPYVPNNHQYKNAMALVDKNAALILEEKDLTAERLKEMIETLIKDEDKLKSFHDNARKLNNDYVLEDIAGVINEYAK